MQLRQNRSTRNILNTSRGATASIRTIRKHTKHLNVTNYNPIDSIMSTPDSASPLHSKNTSPPKRLINCCSDMKLLLTPIVRTKLETCSKVPNSCQMYNLLRSLRFNFGPKIKVKTDKHNEKVFNHREVESLFTARCKDIGIAPNENLKSHFTQFCNGNCIDNKITFNEMGIGKFFTSALRNVFVINCKCTYIEMYNNSLGDEGAENIAKIIKNTKTLVHVDISSSEIKQAGGVSIFKALTNNETVLCFKIGSNKGLHRNRLGPQSMVQLRSALMRNKILSFLDIQYTGIGNEGVALLSDGIKCNTSLVSLNISGNDLTPDSALYVYDVAFHSKLIFLDVSDNALGNQGIFHISEYVAQYKDSHSIIKKLEMNNIGITRGFGISLRNILVKIPDLKSLTLDKNEISSYEDVTEMCSVIYLSKSFSSLSMNSCHITEPSVRYICNTFMGNSVLKDLNLGSNNICSNDIIKKLIEFIQSSNIKKMDLSDNHISDSLGNDIVNSLPGSKIEQLNLAKNYIKSTTLIEGRQNIAKSGVLKLDIKKNIVYTEVIRDIRATIKDNIQRRKSKATLGRQQQLTSFKSSMLERSVISKKLNMQEHKIRKEEIIMSEKEKELTELMDIEKPLTQQVEMLYKEQKEINSQLEGKVTQIDEEINQMQSAVVKNNTLIEEYSKELQEKIKKTKTTINNKKAQYDAEIYELRIKLRAKTKEL